jgi:hypothetical protein
MTFEPILLLAMWAAGLAMVAAVVAWWDIVGRGYLWLTGVTAAVIGLAAAFDSTPGVIAVVLTLAATAIAGRRVASSALFAGGGVAFLTVAAGLDGWLPAIAGSAALGGITGEMLLGHWFLIDPRLPRWALRRLDIAGGLGVVAEIVIAGVRGTLRPPTDLFGFAYLALAATSVLLSVGVWYSLREKGYEGVMAATGLSYLATLTVLAVAFLGRAPVEELLGIG